uniref:FYN-binding protein 2 n=1 Tax=Nannospalax galili TaxID=1026970 RepID=A0A8C6RF88_NANGA
MEARLRPAPNEGGAPAQVVQVEGSGSRAQKRDCKSPGGGESTVGPRIRLWEAGFVSQSPRRWTTMQEEGVKNFKELRAKFQKFDASPLPGPIKFPAGVSRRGDPACTQSTQILPNGKYFSSNHNQPLLYCSNGKSQTIETQKMNLAQRNKIQKSSSSPGPPPEKSAVYPARYTQEASVLLDVKGSRKETSDEEKGMAAGSFRHKLWNWEKVSSQTREMSPALLLAKSENKTVHLKGQKTTGLTQEKTKKNLETTGVQTLLPQKHLMDQKKSSVASEDIPSPLPQHGRKSKGNPGPDRSRGSSPCQPVYECEVTSAIAEQKQHPQLPKTKPLPSIETLGLPPPKPLKPPAVNLQAFHRQPATIAKTPKEGKRMHRGPLLMSLTCDYLLAELEEPHNYEATISYLRHSGNSVNLCAVEETPHFFFIGISSCFSPRHKDEEKNTKEESRELEPQKPEKDLYPNRLLKVSVTWERAPGKIQMTRVHKDRRSTPSRNQEAVTDITQTKAFSEDVKPARHPQDKGGYMEALEVTKETPNPGAITSNSFSEETYDDVACPREDAQKWDFSSSFTSDSEENSEEMYEDIYKAKNNDQKVDLDGKAALKRLQKFFRREKGVFNMKKTNSKGNKSNRFSISLPDLGKDEDKLKTWKAKFLPPKGKKEKKDADGSESFSPRSFFRIKKQNLEKSKKEKEERLFRERFQYDKEIMVINRAVASSSNSRNGTFDLPITPGEQLEVIDTTEQNLVICRNSKGKYGYVLIEHLHFK